MTVETENITYELDKTLHSLNFTLLNIHKVSLQTWSDKLVKWTVEDGVTELNVITADKTELSRRYIGVYIPNGGVWSVCME